MDFSRNSHILFEGPVIDVNFGNGEELLFEEEGDSRSSEVVFARLWCGKFVVISHENEAPPHFLEFAVIELDTRIIGWQILRTVEWRTRGVWCYATFLTDKAFFDFMDCFRVMADAVAVVEVERGIIVRDVHRVWDLRQNAATDGSISTRDDFEDRSDGEDTLRTAPSYSVASLTGSGGDMIDRIESATRTGSAESREELFESSQVDTSVGPVIFGLMLGAVLGVLLLDG